MTGRVLVITNDFPPRRGGIESFVTALCAGLPADRVVVYTSRTAGSKAVDAGVAYPVIRDLSPVLLPTRRVGRAVRRVALQHGCDRVVFGASAPLGLLAGGLREAGVRRVVALSHGHEVWWSTLPGSRSLMRRIGRGADVVTYVSEFCRDRIARALAPADAAAMTRLAPGVDPEVFAPGRDPGPMRRRLGIRPDQPVVLAASRLIPRKGFDVLLEGWPRVLAAHPHAVLVIVGDGSDHRRITRLSHRPEVIGTVRIARDAAWSDMPDYYAGAQVFAQPCRTRLGGLEPEALGIVFLEAAAAGLPVVVGRSGGAPETVRDGVTGRVVDPRSPEQVADTIIGLLDDPVAAREMGERGRGWVSRRFSWTQAVATLHELLELDAD